MDIIQSVLYSNVQCKCYSSYIHVYVHAQVFDTQTDYIAL